MKSMFWKCWPYWVRGGVIGASAVLLSFIFQVACFQLNLQPSRPEGVLECYPLVMISPIFPVMLMLDGWGVPFGIEVIVSLFLWFSLGAVVGWSHAYGQ